MPASVSSLDGFSDTASTTSSEQERRLIQEEWDESVEQLRQLVTVLLMPFFGKWLGRKYSHWRAFSFNYMLLSISLTEHGPVYARYTRLGLGKAFFFGKGVVSS
jgi:hypothetical protein